MNAPSGPSEVTTAVEGKPSAAVSVSVKREPLPEGPWTLMGMMERNQEYIVPTAWREFGEAEALRRLREMQVKNLRARKELLARCETDLVYREEVMARCASDPVFYLSHFAFIWNSDARVVIPFLPLEIQVTEVIYPFYIDQYTPLDPDNPEADRRNHMVEKPRKVGITWCLIACQSWGMCFHHRWPLDGKHMPYVCGVSADVKENVQDRSNPESHMGRAEQIYRNLPVWMLPGPIRPVPDELTDDEGAPKKKRRLKGDTFGESKISFPENKSFFWVKAMTRNVGRSVRFRNWLCDEEEFAKNAGGAVRSLQDATSCLWRVSSIDGNANSFAKDFGNPRLKIARHKIRYFHVPWYGPKWLEAMREGRTDEGFQKEILCNRNAKTGKTYWNPPFDDKVNLVDAVIPMAETQPLYLGIDIGRADGCGLLYLQRDDAAECVNFHGMVYRRDAVTDFMVPFFLGKFPTENEVGDPFPSEENWHPEDRRFVRAIGEKMLKCKSVRYYAGSDATEDRMHADSFVRQMWRLWKIRVEPVRLPDKKEAIDAVTWMIPYLRIERAVNALTPGQYDTTEEAPFTFEDVFYNYRKKTNKDTNEVLESGLPVHDRHSNPADALQILVKEMPRVMRRSPKEIERATKRITAESTRKDERFATTSLFRGYFGRLADAR